MKRIISLLLCFILAFSIYQPALAAENTITWTGEAGDGLWHTAGNWDLERVPEEGDYVIISDSSVVEVNGNTAPVTLDCSGQISVASGGHLYLTGTSYLRTLDNDSFDKLIGDGNITIMGEGSELQCGGGIIGDGTFTIGSGAKLVIDEDATGFGVEMDWYLVNNGKLMLKSGDLYLFGGSEGEGTLTISEGAYLSFGDGAYNVGGDVLNGGVVYISVLSSVFFEANYRQENTGTTVFSVWGSEPGEYCQLNVSGQAELDGILEFDSISADYVPSPGDTFEFMTYGSRDGEFSEIISYPENINFESNYSDTSLILTVVADTTPPELTSVTPASGSTISPYIDSLTLKFNEAVWGDWEKNVTIYTADTNNLVCTLYLNNYDGQNISGNGTDTITLKVPSDTFEFGQSYYILIDEGAFVDAAGNEYAGISDSSTWALTVLNDTEPPTVPTNLRSTSKTSTSVTLEWDPSSDDYGPISYDIYGKTEAGEFVLAGSTESTSFMVIKLADTSLAPETEYTFVVRAADACDNQSEQSNQLRVTTEERPNLIWWEREIPPSSSVYYDTCYGAGKYVAVGTQGTILTSIDEGMSWQLEIGDNFGDSQLKAVTYGNDRFVAVAPSDVYTKTSTDDEWTRIELDAGTVDFNDVTCGKKKDGSGDIFVAVGRNCIWWSEDGVNWQQFLSKPYITDTFVFQEVAADEEGNFVAVGYKEGNYGNNTLLIWKSSNGKNWSSSVDSSLTGQFTGIAYGNGAFMVCGGSVTDIWISTNKGDSWEKGPLPGQDSAYVCPTKIAYGDGLFVAAAGNDVWISDNRGYTWTRSQEFEDFLVSINYCNQSFVASDWDGKIHQAVREPGAVGTIPSVPLNFTATPGDGQVALSWSAPASDGGSTILKYQVSKDNGTNWSDVGLNTTHTFTGLTNGTEYTFKVRAVNSVGYGAETSVTAIPLTVATEPQNFTATPADGQVTLSWTAPESDGGAEITRYEVYKDGDDDWTDVGLDTSYTFTGLTNGTEYTFKVRAVNSVGYGAETSVTAIPLTVATEPQNFTATPADGQVTLSWTAPESDGGNAITCYEVYKDGDDDWTDVGLDTSYTFTGLTNGTEYTFKVRAVNSAGNGAEASVLAIPRAEQIDECFIATAAFGSKFEPAVVLLRNFRDGYLLSNNIGRALVEFYYQHSPPIAAYISHSDPLKTLVRTLLIPVIAVVYLIMHPGTGIACLILLSLFLVVRGSRNRKNALRI
ncbi:MAG: fibronectin type III domain-containing protein [Syntrophomonadaceae bacterium]